MFSQSWRDDAATGGAGQYGSFGRPTGESSQQALLKVLHRGRRSGAYGNIRGMTNGAKALMAFALWMMGCASAPEEPKSRAHNATVVNDLFQVEQGMPIREVKPNQEFFYKHCELQGRWPHFTKSEYSCTQGPF